MAHESFEDPETAAVMNRWFVNIKVDREEQPDVDAVYMDAVQAMTGRGGWPMTVFCTPDGRPFFGGTYFPPERRGGAPSFVDVLERVAAAWETERAEVEGQAERLTAAIGRSAALTPGAAGPSAAVTDAHRHGAPPAATTPHGAASAGRRSSLRPCVTRRCCAPTIAPATTTS